MLTGSYRYLLVLSLLPLLTQLSGCVSFPDISQFEVSGKPQAEISEVPYFPQRRKQCGAATLATVLNYRGVSISSEALEPYVYLPEREGAVSLELVAQTRRFGLLPYPLNGSMESLFAEVRAGNPVIVLQNLGLSWLPQWHFAVVIGYDLNNNTVVLRSGNTPRREESMKTFYATWSRSDFWGLVVIPPDQIPASAEVLDFMKAASDLEAVAQTEAARTAYKAALAHWGDSGQAEAIRLGLANIAYQQGRYDDARTWLLQSIRNAEATAVTWNNLAYVLMAQQCPQQALAVVECAVRLAGDRSSAFLESRDELIGLAGTSEISANDVSDRQCQIPDCS